MPKMNENGPIIGILALSLVTLAGCSATPAQHPGAKTNHFGKYYGQSVNHNASTKVNRHAPDSKRRETNVRYANFNDRLRGRQMLHLQQQAPLPGRMDMFQQWVDYEPQYLLYPGDQIDIVVQSAPELSRTLTIGPDGRITMPMTAPIMAAGQTLQAVQAALTSELSKQLRDPTLAVTSRAFAPQQIFVGGQVGQQGSYTLPGPIGSLEAILMAGGFQPSAKTSEVAILRRAPSGGMMMRVVNHKRGMSNIRTYADNMQLRRGDIIFVPRSNISEVGLFVQQYFRDAMPIDFSLSYNLGNGFSGN